MQQPKSILLQNLRRIGMIVGFAILAIFAYKASHEVSNPRIAAGAQHTHVISAASKTMPVIGNKSLSYTAPALTLSSPIKPNANAAPVPDSPKQQTKLQDKIKIAKHMTVSRSDRSED